MTLRRTIRISLIYCMALIIAMVLVSTPLMCFAQTSGSVINVGSEVEFPPFAEVDQEGQATGFSVDLIKAVSNTMGLTPSFTTGSWDKMWNGLVSGRFDVLPIVAITEERKQLVDFSIPHTETYDAFFVKDGKPPIHSIHEAENKTIVVMRSDVAHHELTDRTFKGKLAIVDTIPEGLLLLSSGKQDAMLCSKLIGVLAMEEYGIKGITAGPIIGDYKRVFAFGIKKGAGELRETINQGLAIVKSNGEYARIYNQWLISRTPHKTKPQKPTPLKTIIIDNYSPYTFVNSKGAPDGYSVELAKSVANVMGMDLDIRVDTWQNAMSALKSGQIDFLPMMAFSPEREKIFDFSAHHTTAYDAFFIRTGSEEIRSLDDLHGKRVIVLKNDRAHDFFQSSGLSKNNQLILADSLPDTLIKLSTGKGDVALMPKLVGLIQMRQLELTNLKLSPLVVDAYNRPFSFAVQKGDHILLDKLNQGLAILKSTGQNQRIYDTWFGGLEPRRISIQTVIAYAIAGIIGFLIIGMVPLIWSILLKKQVIHRTKALEEEIKERQNTEATLRKSENMLKKVLATLPVGVWITDHTGLIIQGNPAGEALWAGARFVGPDQYNEYKGWWLSTGEEIKPEEWAVARAVTKGETSIEEEIEIQCFDGSRKIILNWGVPIFGESGNLENVIAVNQDITSRKQVEEALRASESRYAMILDAVNDGIWDWDVASGNAFFSAMYYGMLGYDNDEFPASYTTWRQIVHPEDMDRVENVLSHSIESGQGFNIDLRMKMKSGDWHWVCTRGKAVEWDSGGKALRMVGTLSDITERKKTEEEQSKLQDLLFQAQKLESIGRLAGGVAHDINNMLSIIIGYAEITLDSLDPSDPNIENMEEILSAGKRSTLVARQLLAFARKQIIAPKVLDLNETIEDILKMLGRLIGEGIHLQWKPANDLWRVKMDSSQIDQILANLTINARDAIDDVGRVIIETANIQLDETYCKTHGDYIPGDYVVLSVSDDGCGMDKETRDNIFEPFYTTKDIGKGTGLGLATVYGIVKQNKGFVTVYSEPDQGSTFRIFIPRFLSDEMPDVKIAESIRPPTGTETVLMVEDEQSILKLGKAMLERLGYTVLTANTPSEALEIAESHEGEIHLLLTDVIMPEMNGSALVKKLLTFKPELKHLFMSGYTANVIAHHGVLEEGVHFIQKPFSLKDLSIKIREALE